MDNSYEEVVKLRSDQVVWRQVGDEVMVLDTASSQYLSVNKTASVLWPLLLQGCSPAALAGLLEERYGVDGARASADVDLLLSKLAGLGLLERAAKLTVKDPLLPCPCRRRPPPLGPGCGAGFPGERAACRVPPPRNLGLDAAVPRQPARSALVAGRPPGLGGCRLGHFARRLGHPVGVPGRCL